MTSTMEKGNEYDSSSRACQATVGDGCFRIRLISRPGIKLRTGNMVSKAMVEERSARASGLAIYLEVFWSSLKAVGSLPYQGEGGQRAVFMRDGGVEKRLLTIDERFTR